MMNFNNGIQIQDVIFNEQLLKNVFEDSNLANDIIDQNDYQYKRYLLKPQMLENEYFNVVIIFNPHQKLYSLGLCYCFQGEILSWENWSEERELERKKKQDEWLEKLLGKAKIKRIYDGKYTENYYEFKWGKISSFYDPKSAGSIIEIRYNRNKIQRDGVKGHK